jgi:hypothetical protein
MKIAIIGWGYLIWDRRSLDVAPEWLPDGPLLPVEFARFATPPRLLPVLVERAPLQPTFWAFSQKQSVLAAAADLAVREGVGTHDIGYWSSDDSMRRPVGLEAVIAQWAESKVLDGAVWRAVQPNLPDRSPGFPSEQQRLDFLRELVATGQEQDAREYFERMPAQIRTPFQALVERELGWRSAPVAPALPG